MAAAQWRMVERGKGRATAPRFPFIGGTAWRRVQAPSGMDRLARAAVANAGLGVRGDGAWRRGVWQLGG
jgi:hypothetical protein